MLTYSLVYWIVLIVAIAVGGIWNRDSFGTWAGNNLLYLVLFVIIGLKIFG